MDFKSEQKDYKLGKGFQIGTKRFQIGAREIKDWARDFKSGQGLQTCTEQHFYIYDKKCFIDFFIHFKI